MKRSGKRKGKRVCALVVATLSTLQVTASARAAQSSAPFAEWQFSGGVLLERMDRGDEPAPDWSVQLGAGPSLGPRYEGSQRYTVEPEPLVEVRYRDVAFASLGEGVGVNLLHSGSHRAGLAVTADLGRNDDDDARLRGLGDVSFTPELKAFAETVLFPVTLRADVRRGFGGHDGWIGDLSAYLPIVANDRLAVLAGPSLTFADGRWMRSYFGVDDTQSARSGFDRYRPRGGFASASFGVTVAWSLSDHWFVETLGAARYAFDEEADSPIVQTRDGYLLSMFLGYDF